MKTINYDIHISEDPEFIEVVNTLAKEVDEIIETGTFDGLGSTLIFAKTEKPVISIECNEQNYRNAQRNLANYENVTLLHAHSLDYYEMIKFIESDDIYSQNLDIAVENPSDPKSFYKREISYPSMKQNVLIDLINNTKKQIIFLDSAGGVGYLEFKKVMSLPQEILKNKILILDDVQHVKHYRSAKELGEKFIYSKSKRWGYARL